MATRPGTRQRTSSAIGGGMDAHAVLRRWNAKAEIAVRAAHQWVGQGYCISCGDPNGGRCTCCAGLTAWAWKAAGVNFPPGPGMVNAPFQYAAFPHVARGDWLPGDLLFFYRPVSHVALYVGGGMMISASNPADGIQLIPVWTSLYAGAARPAWPHGVPTIGGGANVPAVPPAGAGNHRQRPGRGNAAGTTPATAQTRSTVSSALCASLGLAGIGLCQATSTVGTVLANVGRWMEIGGGGAIMLIGGATMLYGGSQRLRQAGGTVAKIGGGVATGGLGLAAAGAVSTVKAAGKNSSAPARPDVQALKVKRQQNAEAAADQRAKELAAKSRAATEQDAIDREYADLVRQSNAAKVSGKSGPKPTSIKGVGRGRRSNYTTR